MSTFLTVYFWLMAVLYVVSFLFALFRPVTPTVVSVGTTGEDAYKAIGKALLFLALTPLLAAPLTYLQWLGLQHLGFSPWWAVVSLTLGTVAAVVRAPQIKKLGNQPENLMLWGILLAWYGLQVLTA